MMRLWSIAIHETSGQLGRIGVRAVIVVAVVIAMLVASLNARDFERRRQEYDRAVLARAAGTIDQDGLTIPTRLRALRPPSPGSVFVRGLERSTPTSWDFAPEGLKESGVRTSRLEDSGIGPLFDLESVVRILFGLLAIALGVETIAVDRTRGTLGALLSQPIGPITIAFGKLFGGAITLSLAIGLTILAGIAAASQMAPMLSGIAIRDTLPAFAAVSSTYAITLYAMGMLIGTVISSHRPALAVGISVWMAGALAAPPLVAFGARTLAPVESRQAAELAMSTSYKQYSDEALRLLGLTFVPFSETDDYMKRRLPPPQWLREQLEAQWTAEATTTRKNVDQLESSWVAQLAARQYWTVWLSKLTPSTAYWLAASDVAGTGQAFNSGLNTTVRTYERDINAGLFDNPARLILRVPFHGRTSLAGYDRPVPNDRDFPTFQPPVRTPRERLRDARSTWLVLVAYCVVFVALAVTVFPRRVL